MYPNPTEHMNADNKMVVLAHVKRKLNSRRVVGGGFQKSDTTSTTAGLRDEEVMSSTGSMARLYKTSKVPSSMVRPRHSHI